jgi:hypothetical protein
MQTYFIGFRKQLHPLKRTVRVEFSVPAISPQEARLIIERERAALLGHGYRFMGSN